MLISQPRMFGVDFHFSPFFQFHQITFNAHNGPAPPYRCRVAQKRLRRFERPPVPSNIRFTKHLLELRSQGQRDVLGMQFGSLLRRILSAQRLGATSSGALTRLFFIPFPYLISNIDSPRFVDRRTVTSIRQYLADRPPEYRHREHRPRRIRRRRSRHPAPASAVAPYPIQLASNDASSFSNRRRQFSYSSQTYMN